MPLVLHGVIVEQERIKGKMDVNRVCWPLLVLRLPLFLILPFVLCFAVGFCLPLLWLRIPLFLILPFVLCFALGEQWGNGEER